VLGIIGKVVQVFGPGFCSGDTDDLEPYTLLEALVVC